MSSLAHDVPPVRVALLSPPIKGELREGWGTSSAKVAKDLPLLAAIEIKRGGGNVTSLSLVRKDLRDLNEIANSDPLGYPITYFLAWIDSNLKRRPRQTNRYLDVQEELENWCQESPQSRSAFLLSRDRVGFAYPKRSWVVQPLPPGTSEHPSK